ncbi:MAG TPA: zf-HC2 domain-containing protein, partial [Mycobacterium sp.]|nr:zf-HC2 domain-containing protein [Mycobacterium sp.]
MRDDERVQCEVAREALSARLDGERQHVPGRRVDAHLESCAKCRAWLIEAAAQARRFASVEIGQGPDLAEQIIAAAGIEPARRHRTASRNVRGALAAVGVLLVLVGMTLAVTGVHEVWSLALGLGIAAAGVLVLGPVFWVRVTRGRQASHRSAQTDAGAEDLVLPAGATRGR